MRWLDGVTDPLDCSLLGSSVCGIFSGKTAGVGRHFLLQGIFPTQGSNPGLLHCRQNLYRLGYKGSPLSDTETQPSKSLTAAMLLLQIFVFQDEVSDLKGTVF